jgi:hypothetical protein
MNFARGSIDKLNTWSICQGYGDLPTGADVASPAKKSGTAGLAHFTLNFSRHFLCYPEQ